jgi:DNA-binding MarR family transcriptional regulator
MLSDVAKKSGVPASSRRSLGARGAEKDWTDALLDDFAAAGPRQDMEPYQVTARLSRLALHVARVQEESFGKYGLNRGEVGVLAALRFAGPKQQSSPTRLFKGLMLSSAGITSRLDRLQQRGYVKRMRHPDDRRGVLVELTDSGRHVLEMAVNADTARERELVAGLTAAERKSLAALLKKLLSSLEPNSAGG